MESEPLDPPAEPVASARPFWRTRKAVLLACLVAAVVALTTAVVFVRAAEPDTVRTVRAFLTAARERDPARAFEAGGVTTPPSGDGARFLAADAMSDEWEIRSVEESYHYEHSGTAEVRVTIAGPDGHTASTTMGLTRRGDRWTIDEPFFRIGFLAGPFWYAEVNGVRTPTDVHPPVLDYPLFPGFYRFYGTTPSGVEVRYPPLLALPERYSTPARLVQPAAVTVTAEGEQLVQRAVDAYVDTCAESTEAAPDGCPFGTDPVTGPRLPDVGYLYDIEGFRWRVVEYPIVAVVPGETGLGITDRRRGVVELSASGHHLGEESDTRPVAFTVQCEIITSRLVAGLTAESTVTVLSAYQQATVSPEDTRDTCTHPLPVGEEG
jgi:hypothetical protein